MRLAKYLAQSGIVSRRKAETIIIAGRVQVNGQVVTHPGTSINPNCDNIMLDDEQVFNQSARVYILLNKPSGYLTSVSDPYQRPTVMELIKEQIPGLHPVGRLDLDTKGLLLLTNDGKFTNLMIHPRYKVVKTYQVKVKGQVTTATIDDLAQGVRLEEGITAPAKVKLVQYLAEQTVLEIQIHEGRKRQIKRMCATLGHKVVELIRTGYSFLNLEGVALGSYRYLTAEELQRLAKPTD